MVEGVARPVFVLQEIGGLGEGRRGGGADRDSSAVVYWHVSPQGCCTGHVATLITPELFADVRSELGRN